MRRFPRLIGRQKLTLFPGLPKLRDGSGAGPKAGTVRMERSAVVVGDSQNRVLAMHIGDDMAAATFA